MVIPVKSEHKNRVPGFIHSASSSGATVFIEPTETLELNNDISGLQFQEQREVERILARADRAGGTDRGRAAGEPGASGRAGRIPGAREIFNRSTRSGTADNGNGTHRPARSASPLLILAHGYAATVPLDLEVGGEWRRCSSAVRMRGERASP